MPARSEPSEQRFDAAYYSRFYGRRPVHDRKRIAHLASGVTSMAAWWRIPIHSVLDIGAGKGYWRDWLGEHRPRVSYHGLDVSEHACARYGHELADISNWRAPRTYDLIVCQSVIQYLDDAAAARALKTIGDACRGLLLFEAPTTGDLDTVIDHEGTDMDVHWRSGRWYRHNLSLSSRQIGGGLWLSRACDVPFFELEAAGG